MVQFNILDWWPVFLGLGAIIAWGFRLESKVHMNAKGITDLEAHLTKVTAEVAAQAVTAIQMARVEEQIRSLTERVGEQNTLIRDYLMPRQPPHS